MLAPNKLIWLKILRHILINIYEVYCCFMSIHERNETIVFATPQCVGCAHFIKVDPLKEYSPSKK